MIENLEIVWQSIEPFRGELVAFALALLGTLVAWFLRGRVRLIWGRSNSSIHFVPLRDGEGKETSKVEIYAEKYFLQNTGRKAATNVEFVLDGHFPDDLSLSQPRQYTRVVNPDGALVITVPFIAPYELIVIDAVYIDKKAATVDSVKCAEIVARQVAFSTVRNFGRNFGITVLILMLLGVAFLLRILGIWLFGS